MELIAAQQAQSAIRIREIERIIVSFARVTSDRFHGTDERVDEVNEKIAALVDSQIRTEENVKKTDEALRNLIAVVDRYFDEGRSGNSRG